MKTSMDELKQPTTPSDAGNKYLTEDDARTLFNSMITNYAGMMRVQSGILQSGNYQAGVSGWGLKANGDIDANSGTFRGALSGATGTFTGALTASSIVDDTFGLNGCFIKQIKTTDYSTAILAIPIYRANGSTPISTGLLAVIGNWYSNATGRYNFLPGINNATGTSYFSIQKNAGNYEVRHLGANQGAELPSHGYTIYTCLFSSDESTYY